MIYRTFLSLLICFGLVGVAAAQSTKTEYSAGFSAAGGSYELTLDARLVAKGAPIERGLIWRIFGDKPESDGSLPLIATATGGSASFKLPSGTYLVHSAFGRAGASKRIILSSEGASEVFILEAGGLQLNAETLGQKILDRDLRFSIYELEQNEEGDRKLIALNVAANKVIRLNAGTYHVLSRFGTINATVRADLEVKAGEVTKALLQHRGAALSLRLVSKSGGNPIANTAWTVFTEDGEKVFESQNISPSLILAEGTYETSVRYGTRDIKQTFDIKPGKPIRLEVLFVQQP